MDRFRLRSFRRSRRLHCCGLDDLLLRWRELCRRGRNVDAQFLAQPVGQTILDCIGVRRHRHTHVLQFANDLGIIAIQLAG